MLHTFLTKLFKFALVVIAVCTAFTFPMLCCACLLLLLNWKEWIED